MAEEQHQNSDIFVTKLFYDLNAKGEIENYFLAALEQNLLSKEEFDLIHLSNAVELVKFNVDILMTISRAWYRLGLIGRKGELMS